MRIWHKLLGHTFSTRRVSVPLFDPSARGILIRCSCGKDWAL